MTPTDLAAKMILAIREREENWEEKHGLDLGCGTGQLTCCLLYLGCR